MNCLLPGPSSYFGHAALHLPSLKTSKPCVAAAMTVPRPNLISSPRCSHTGKLPNTGRLGMNGYTVRAVSSGSGDRRADGARQSSLPSSREAGKVGSPRASSSGATSTQQQPVRGGASKLLPVDPSNPQPVQQVAPAGGRQGKDGRQDSNNSAPSRSSNRQQRRGQVRFTPSEVDVEEEEEEEEEEEGEEDDMDIGYGEAVSAKEAERLIFGNKDFTKGPVVQVDKAAAHELCSLALVALGLPQDAVLAVMKLQHQGKIPVEHEALSAKMQASLTAAGGAERFLPAVQQLAASLSLPEAGWNLAVEDAMVAAITASRVLSMPNAAVVQRAAEVQSLLRVTPRRARELCCRSPAMLLVPKSALETKLKTMSLATGLDMEACAIMLTVHMFPGLA